MTIHPTAVIDPKAELDSTVTVGPYAIINENVRIDAGTKIDGHAIVSGPSTIGKNNTISSFATVGGDPQDLKFQGEYTLTEIGDNTIIREYVTINKGTRAKDKTVVGKDCLIMSYVHIAHDCMLQDRVILGSYAGLAGEVEVDQWAIISPGSLVHQFVRIGAHVMIQGGSKVSKDVPPFSMSGREPISFTGINSIGLRRRGFTNDTIYAIQEVYRIIYQRGLNISDALEFVEANLPASKERDEIILFVRESKRGIIRGYFDGKDT